MLSELSLAELSRWVGVGTASITVGSVGIDGGTLLVPVWVNNDQDDFGAIVDDDDDDDDNDDDNDDD